jgi:DNA invertase Pin-like site-specific DNA recombinase
MPRQTLAITTCRVSTPEQVENNSLGRQAEAVVSAAKELEAVIPEDGQWSGSVSSKAGTNINRKDLKEMLDYCKKHSQVKYLIVHEVDRFMRSVDELFYFEVLFRAEVGVKIIYASQPELNTDDYKAKLFKALEAFKGEGSNVERQKKSIDGQTTALKQGRYPFSPKPGYKRGYERGIQEPHEVRGPILKDTLLQIVSRLVTPTQALINFNKSDFMLGHSPYKMDKFRTIVTDPFYAGIVEIDKQVKVRNVNGLHEALISKEQHLELVKIMNDKKKNQSGPRKNGNPKYPLSNLVSCELCTDKTNGRYVGYDHGNGKSKVLVYEKYRCRGCGRYLTRQELHEKIKEQFSKNPISNEGLKDLLRALETVWKQKEGEAVQETVRIQHKIRTLNETISTQVEAATDPSNASIKEDILASITKKKAEVTELEDELDGLASEADSDKEQFLQFAFNFLEDMGGQFLELSPENRLRCKQVIFPAGFYLDAENKVYTPEISPLITLAAKKKDTEVSDNSLLVRVRGL